MTTELIVACVTVTVPVVGIIGWLFSLAGRIAVIERRLDDYKTLVESKFEDIRDRLDRIERLLVR